MAYKSYALITVLCNSCKFRPPNYGGQGNASRTLADDKMLTCWSPSPLNGIFCPSFIPGSTCTSKILLSSTTFFPLQFLHLSLSLIHSPARKIPHCGCQPKLVTIQGYGHMLLHDVPHLTYTSVVVGGKSSWMWRVHHRNQEYLRRTTAFATPWDKEMYRSQN